MTLDTVPYASNGSFALSLWMRRLPGASVEGSLFQYLFSHGGVADTSAQSPNQVALRGGAGCAIDTAQAPQLAGAAGCLHWCRPATACAPCPCRSPTALPPLARHIPHRLPSTCPTAATPLMAPCASTSQVGASQLRSRPAAAAGWGRQSGGRTGPSPSGAGSRDNPRCWPSSPSQHCADSNDRAAELTYLDSDGTLAGTRGGRTPSHAGGRPLAWCTGPAMPAACPAWRASAPSCPVIFPPSLLPSADVNDGEWHMITGWARRGQRQGAGGACLPPALQSPRAALARSTTARRSLCRHLRLAPVALQSPPSQTTPRATPSTLMVTWCAAVAATAAALASSCVSPTLGMRMHTHNCGAARPRLRRAA